MTAAQDGLTTIRPASRGLASGALLPPALGLAHGVSDCVAGYLIGWLALSGDPVQAGWLALAYNGLAFGTQPGAGWLADRSGRYREMLLAGLALGGAALLLLAFQPALAMGLAGLGSAALHAAGGGLALQATPGRAAGPGFFAAPGVVGLALGGLLAVQGSNPTWMLLLALAATGGMAAFVCPTRRARIAPPNVQTNVEWIILWLVLALALRSTVWTGLELRADGQATLLLQIALAAGLGKALGGPLADRLTWRRWVILALALAAVLLTIHGITGGGALALLAGVFFLQSITPALLAALGKALPEQPGLAASLGLGLAVILGGLPVLVGWGQH